MADQADNEARSGLIRWVQTQPRALRYLIFFLAVALVVGLMFAGTALLYYQNVRNFPRSVPAALEEGVTWQEFALFQEETAYPAALALAQDGTLYTGSYASGAVWRISPEGTVQEIPGTREQISSVTGLHVTADGTLYVLDRVVAARITAQVWRVEGDDVTLLLDVMQRGFDNVMQPNDIMLDAAGNLYVADINTGVVWRVEAETLDSAVFWRLDEERVAPSGLAYDAGRDALLIADAGRDRIYRLPLGADDPLAAMETLYAYEGAQEEAPGINGITLAPDGTLYVALLGQNAVARLDEETGELLVLAVGFRGSSDVAYDAQRQRLYVNNWDQRWLLPIDFFLVQFYVEPRLPFSVDVLEIAPRLTE